MPAKNENVLTSITRDMLWESISDYLSNKKSFEIIIFYYANQIITIMRTKFKIEEVII